MTTLMKKPSTPALRRELLTMLINLRSWASNTASSKRRAEVNSRLRENYREFKAQVLSMEEDALVCTSRVQRTSAEFSAEMKYWTFNANVRAIERKPLDRPREPRKGPRERKLQNGTQKVAPPTPPIREPEPPPIAQPPTVIVKESRTLAAMRRWREQQLSKLEDPQASEEQKRMVRLSLGVGEPADKSKGASA